MSDSRLDTLEHIAAVRERMLDVAIELIRRAHVHDASKLEEPELSMFDIYRQKLDEYEHDSPEYKQALVEMGEPLEHHYRHNRHHPEHFADGIHGMDAIDLIELVCDWLAAAARQGDPLAPYIDGGAMERFGYGEELRRLLQNTREAIE